MQTGTNSDNKLKLTEIYTLHVHPCTICHMIGWKMYKIVARLIRIVSETFVDVVNVIKSLSNETCQQTEIMKQDNK